jgi:hypothetical protein
MVQMVGTQPIDFYYPDGLSGQAITPSNNNEGCIDWITERIINYRYAGADAQRPIFENTLIGKNRTGCDSPSLRVSAEYRRQLGPNNPSTGRRTTQTVCSGVGPIKYAYITGKLPDTLTFNIDTGSFEGCIPELDTFLGKDVLGSEMTPPRTASGADGQAVSDYGFNYGEQEPQRYDETNYASGGSSALYSGGFGTAISIPFIARAFDSSDPYGNYIDGEFVLNVLNNWSSDRDSLVLNIRNQMYLDGKPVTNAEYLNGMKAKGYFNDIGTCTCDEE